MAWYTRKTKSTRYWKIISILLIGFVIVGCNPIETKEVNANYITEDMPKWWVKIYSEADQHYAHVLQESNISTEKLKKLAYLLEKRIYMRSLAVSLEQYLIIENEIDRITIELKNKVRSISAHRAIRSYQNIFSFSKLRRFHATIKWMELTQ